MLGRVIFKAVGDVKARTRTTGTRQRQWGELAPTQVRLDQLVTTKRELDLEALLAEDSTYFGDLFAHVVRVAGQPLPRGRAAPRAACGPAAAPGPARPHPDPRRLTGRLA